MKLPDTQRFSNDLDRILAGKPVDTHDLPPEDARALELAHQAAKIELAAGHNKGRLRQRLERRAASLSRPRHPFFSNLWAPWLGLAVLALLFLNGAFNSLAPLETPANAAIATAWVSPASLNPVSIAHPVFPQTAQPQPDVQLHPYEIPRPMPTPLAPPGTTLPALYPAAYTPGGSAPIATP